MTNGPDPLGVACALTVLLDELEIRYVIGGSLASAIHGEPRFTKDVDIVAALGQEHVDLLANRLEPEFFVDRLAISEAILHRRLFQLVHRASYMKIDVFVPRPGGLDEQKWARRQRVALADGEAWVTDPESIVLQKLEWYRAGGGLSDQQWRDVLGILKVQKERLDESYLRSWAERLGVSDGLARGVAAGRAGTVQARDTLRSYGRISTSIASVNPIPVPSGWAGSRLQAWA